jgi:hypothetical protein
MIGEAGTMPAATTPARAGHTRIARSALQKTVEAITARAFRVDPHQVRAELEDDAGKLGVNLTVKMALPPLLAPRRDGGGTVFDQAHAVRTELVARGLELTGLEFGRVDVRLMGAKPQQSKERRVE